MFEAHHADYFTPEKRSFQVLIVDQAKLEQSHDHLRRGSARGLQRVDGQFPDAGAREGAAHPDQDARASPMPRRKQALAKAEDILKQLKAGADFSQLAKKYSEDTSNAPKGGDLGGSCAGRWCRSSIRPRSRMKPGELSGIVTTEFGYHIIKVNEKEHRAGEAVRGSQGGSRRGVEEASRSPTDAEDRRISVHDALVKSPGSAAEIAKKFGVDVVHGDRRHSPVRRCRRWDRFRKSTARWRR